MQINNNARTQKVFSEGGQLWQVFIYILEGLQIPLKEGHHRPGANDGPTLKAGLVSF